MIKEKLKGAKVNIVSRDARESYIGLISDVEDDWLELVPFAPGPVQVHFKDIDPDIQIMPIYTTMYKRFSSIDTIIILEKPDKEFYGKDEVESSDPK